MIYLLIFLLAAGFGDAHNPSNASLPIWSLIWSISSGQNRWPYKRDLLQYLSYGLRTTERMGRGTTDTPSLMDATSSCAKRVAIDPPLLPYFHRIQIPLFLAFTTFVNARINPASCKGNILERTHKELTQFHGRVTYCNKLTRNCLMDNGKLDGRVIRTESFRISTLLEVEHKKTLK